MTKTVPVQRVALLHYDAWEDEAAQTVGVSVTQQAHRSLSHRSRGDYMHQHKILAGIVFAVLAGAVGWYWRQWRDEQW